MAKTKPISIDQGATWKLALRKYTVSGGVKTPVNLTVDGYACKMQVRRSFSDAKVFCQIDSEQTGGITLGGTGEIDLVISGARTAAIPAGPAVYDILLTMPDGSTQRLLEGPAEIKPSVTR